MNYYGQIDLTLIGDLVRQHQDCIKKVQFQDGREHMLLNINVYENKEPDRNGNSHAIKAGIPKEKQIQGGKYYVGNIKPSQQAQVASAPAQTAAPAPPSGEDKLPF